MPSSKALTASLITKLIAFVLQLPAGRIADVYGVGLLTFVNGTLTMLLGLPVFTLMTLQPDSILTLCCICIGFRSALDYADALSLRRGVVPDTHPRYVLGNHMEHIAVDFRRHWDRARGGVA